MFFLCHQKYDYHLPTASEHVCDLLNSSEQHYVQLTCCCVIFTTVMIINSSFSIHISILLVTNVTNQRFSLQSQRLRSSPSTVNWLTKPNDSFKGKSAVSLQRSRPTGKGSVRACMHTQTQSLICSAGRCVFIGR